MRAYCLNTLHIKKYHQLIFDFNFFFDRSRSENSRHNRDKSPGDPKKMLPEALTKQCLVRCRVSTK